MITFQVDLVSFKSSERGDVNLPTGNTALSISEEFIVQNIDTELYSIITESGDEYIFSAVDNAAVQAALGALIIST